LYILLFAVIALLLVELTVRLYRKGWSRKLGLDLHFGSDAVFEGEKGEILETVVNKKLMPLWWADLQFRVSGTIRFDGEDERDHENYKKESVSVLSYEMVRRSLRFTALRRGYYKIDGADLVSGDPFFRYKFIRQYPVSSELYVYPCVKGVGKFNVDFRKITGEVIARRHVIEDPFEFRGIRDYYPFDSLKSVNWNATAKTGQIKVNQYHYTSSQEVVLLLDMEGYNAFDKPELREDLIRVAAYLSRMLIASGIPVGLCSNARDIVTGDALAFACKNGAGQEKTLLRAFARIDADPDKASQPFARILQEKIACRTEPHYILISYYAGDALQAAVQSLMRNGHSFQWLLLEDRARRIDLGGMKNLTICEADY
jgi:uncharacterized protein (DUF58 family)